MSLISKQIEELRAYAADRKGELAKIVSDAADTIESLSEKLSAANKKLSETPTCSGKANNWIPVSERPPIEPGEYTVTINDGWAVYVTTLRFGWADTEYGITKDMVFYIEDMERGDDVIEDVTAWRPLIEPYKERTDEHR